MYNSIDYIITENRRKIMDIGVYFGIAAVVLVLFVYQSYKYNKERKSKILMNLLESWGTRPTREYDYDEFENITHYFKHLSTDGEVIDNITWNDLDMDTIFMLLNNTNSSVGEEYLYNLLRTPVKDKHILAERDKLISFFENNKDISIALGKKFNDLGRTKKLSVYEYITNITSLGKRSNGKHITGLLLLLASIALLFIFPPIGIVAVIAMISINVITYYKFKAEIENYFICFKYIVGLIVTADNIIDMNIPELSEYNVKLKELCRDLNGLKKGIGLITSNNMTGSLAEIIGDYIRMITHIDLMKFNSMLGQTIERLDKVHALYEVIGCIEAMKAIASFRVMLPYYTVPVLVSKNVSLSFKEIYHPMIDNPVANSLHETKCVLLTGSNASGKSTFLKTVAINAILAQTIYTCLAKEYVTPFYDIYSSMALRDDLENNESYYIVEIKSLKRILDKVQNGNHVLCFVDEVLRGTNTIERIAASSRILKLLAESDIMCFAATHDIELTHILKNYFSNYHFQEEVKDNDVLFNYRLYTGRAVSRNAIKLLGVMGYDDDIINSAEDAANNFLTNGNWKNFS